jgi:hypothetical protein
MQEKREGRHRTGGGDFGQDEAHPSVRMLDLVQMRERRQMVMKGRKYKYEHKKGTEESKWQAGGTKNKGQAQNLG